MSIDPVAYKKKFDGEAALSLARQLASVYQEFDSERFVRLTTRGLGVLDFRGRLQRFARVLRECLPPDYVDALSILVDSLPEPLEDGVSPFEGWLQWPIAEFISLFGGESPEESMEAIEALAQVFAAEYAVRPLLRRYFNDIADCLLDLSSHPCGCVRRFCAESLRARLPWGVVVEQLQTDPERVLPVLEVLKSDPLPAVRRSVADCLNDLSRSQPDWVVEVCRGWMREPSEPLTAVVRQGLRGLVKEGHQGALSLLGFEPSADSLKVEFSCAPRSLVLGEAVKFKAALCNVSQGLLRFNLDLVLHLTKADGQARTRVLPWKALELPAGRRVELLKEQPMKAEALGELHPGAHRVQLRASGEPLAESQFHLI